MSWNIKTPGDYINGPLTVAGNVGIGTTTFTSIAGYTSLKINNATNGAILDLAQGDAYKGRVIGSLNGLILESAVGLPVQIQVGGLNSFKADPAGVYTWYDGAGGVNQRMQLNSTGLGIGGSPLDRLTVVGNSFLRGADAGVRIGDGGGYGFISAYDQTLSTAKNLVLQTQGSSVGIGVQPSPWSPGFNVVEGAGGALFSGSNTAMRIAQGAYFGSSDYRFKFAVAASRFEMASGQYVFYTSNNTPVIGNAITWTQAMTLTDAGDLLVGTTSNPNSSRAAVKTASVTSALSLNSVTGDTAQELFVINKFDSNSTTSQVFARFTNNNGAAGSGQINGNGANACAFGSFSDARLKENIVSLPSQLANILSLRPVEFDYKDGSGHQIGFVAQEIQEVYADTVAEQNGFLTVTGWSKTEARLVSAIKELAAKVQALEAKLA